MRKRCAGLVGVIVAAFLVPSMAAAQAPQLPDRVAAVGPYAAATDAPVTQSQRGTKSPAVAGILSLVLVPGIGSFYASNSGHGIRHLVIHVAAVGVTVGAALSASDEILTDGTVDEGSLTLVYVGATLLFANWIWSGVTAINDAHAYNRGEVAFLEPRIRTLAVSSTMARSLNPESQRRVALQFSALRF